MLSTSSPTDSPAKTNPETPASTHAITSCSSSTTATATTGEVGTETRRRLTAARPSAELTSTTSTSGFGVATTSAASKEAVPATRTPPSILSKAARPSRWTRTSLTRKTRISWGWIKSRPQGTRQRTQLDQDTRDALGGVLRGKLCQLHRSYATSPNPVNPSRAPADLDHLDARDEPLDPVHHLADRRSGVGDREDHQRRLAAFARAVRARLDPQ